MKDLDTKERFMKSVGLLTDGEKIISDTDITAGSEFRDQDVDGLTPVECAALEDSIMRHSKVLDLLGRH